MIKVTNNYLDAEDFYILQKTIGEEFFPWHIAQKENPLVFYHTVFRKENGTERPSKFMPIILNNLLKKLKLKSIEECQINLVCKSKEQIEMTRNINKDNDIDSKTVILFINTSDSYIECLNHKIEAVENRIIFLESGALHSFFSPVRDSFASFLKIDYL